MSEFVVLLLERNNNNDDKKQLCWTIFNNIYTREKGMSKKSRSLYYWLIDESSLYLETERGKHYSSTICFQCFMFAKREVGRSKMLNKILLNVEKEREIRVPTTYFVVLLYLHNNNWHLCIPNSDRSRNLHPFINQ